LTKDITKGLEGLVDLDERVSLVAPEDADFASRMRKGKPVLTVPDLCRFEDMLENLKRGLYELVLTPVGSKKNGKRTSIRATLYHVLVPPGLWKALADNTVIGSNERYAVYDLDRECFTILEAGWVHSCYEQKYTGAEGWA